MHPTDTPAPRLPSDYLCHGGGPWPYLQGPLREQLCGLEAGLLDVPRQLPQRPEAVLVVSAHWITDDFAVSTAAAPGMVYDYVGFPPEMYRVRYPALGAPALAERATRRRALASWARAPYARTVHPHEDHLLPLMVAASAATAGARP